MGFCRTDPLGARTLPKREGGREREREASPTIAASRQPVASPTIGARTVYGTVDVAFGVLLLWGLVRDPIVGVALPWRNCRCRAREYPAHRQNVASKGSITIGDPPHRRPGTATQHKMAVKQGHHCQWHATTQHIGRTSPRKDRSPLATQRIGDPARRPSTRWQ
jgi:hypothetical protein